MFEYKDNYKKMIFVITIYGNKEVDYRLDVIYLDDLYFEVFLN